MVDTREIHRAPLLERIEELETQLAEAREKISALQDLYNVTNDLVEVCEGVIDGLNAELAEAVQDLQAAENRIQVSAKEHLDRLAEEKDKLREAIASVKNGHFCPEWDGLFIHDGVDEADGCHCFAARAGEGE